MQVPTPISRFRHFLQFLSLLVTLRFDFASGYGSMGPISAAFGETGFFCAIDASGRQSVICWGRNTSATPPSSSSTPFSNIPAMAALSGGEGFLCGILANTSQAYCWSFNNPEINLVPEFYRTTAYSNVAAGRNHVCAVSGIYYSDQDSGTVECWEIKMSSNRSLSSEVTSSFYDPSINNLMFREVVSGERFSCGAVREGGVVCWGPKSESLGASGVSDSFVVLAAGEGSVCGILEGSGIVRCWGDNSSFVGLPEATQFTSLTAGASHFCGIRQDNHEAECWGNFNSSVLPKGSGFSALASSDFSICGIKDVDLVLGCWLFNSSSIHDYDPPLELCSPGLCTPRSCGEGEFTFNASILNEPDLRSLCVRDDLKICSPCGLNCSEGSFLSSPCTASADRVCTSCSLCQNSSCFGVCGLPKSQEVQRKRFGLLHILILIIGCCALGIMLLVLCWCLLPRVVVNPVEEGKKKQFRSCMGKKDVEKDINDESEPTLPSALSVGAAQVFRLTELKDATNGFKEINELGRGSYGFVYKAVLPDGQQVAVKRANAATIIHTNTREFETELDILCKIRHPNIMNLLGYCSEMGERLLVYEYMPHGTLHDHLHGGLSPLNWRLRIKIVMQAAKGLEYLHKEAVPPIIHRDVKSSNILLDADWGARIADFGLLTSSEKDPSDDTKSDVYNFGIVLLEILSGRKAYDIDYTRPNIVEWAVPLIKKGKGAAIIDRYVALPRNVEPLLKLADMAELALRENPSERPSMSEIASWLEQIVKDGLVF